MRGGSRLLLLGCQDVAFGRFDVATCTAAVLHEKPDRHVWNISQVPIMSSILLLSMLASTKVQVS
jgi:hypothetical protein